MWIKILFIFILSISYAFGACNNLQLSNIPTSFNLNNDISPRINFQVTRTTPSGTCTYIIGIDRGSAPSYARKLYKLPDDMDFQIAKRNNMNNILKDRVDTINSNELIIRSFNGPNNPSRNHRFYAELTLDPNTPAGHYEDTYNVKLYETVGFFGYTLVDTHAITFYYDVPEQVALSIVNSNTSFVETDTSQDVDFEELTQGESESMDIVVQTSAGYILNVSSGNNGKMKHVSTNSFIDYIFKVNGSAVNLSNSNLTPVTISSGVGSHTGDGFRVPIDIEVGDVTNKLSGDYADNITVTVTTNL